MSVRSLQKSPEIQGVDEAVAWEADVTKWVVSDPPTNPTCKLYRIDASVHTDVTDVNLTGSASVLGNVVTSPIVSGLTAGEKYRLVFRFNLGTQLASAYLDLYVEQ